MEDRIYGNIDNVRAELKGNTEIDSDIEEQLIERIAEIEANDGVVPPMLKPDWIAIIVMTAISVIGIIITLGLF